MFILGLVVQTDESLVGSKAIVGMAKKRERKKPEVLDFLSLRDYLQSYYDWRKATVGSFSYRQFAEDMGFARSNILHLVIQGKRPLTRSSEAKLIAGLELSEKSAQYFHALAGITRAKTEEDSQQAIAKVTTLKQGQLKNSLDHDQYAYYSEWWHTVVREMVALDNFVYDPKWIASRIWPKVTVEQVEESLELLKKLELIVFDKVENRWQQTQQMIAAIPEVRKMSVVRYHNASITQGLKALNELSGEQRHISALTLSVNEEQVKRIRDAIKRFQSELLQIEQDGREGSDRVVQMNIQLFPSTQVPRSSKTKDEN